MGEEFVALNGNVRKLAKLLLEHGESESEKKILNVGETWEIDDWKLTVQSIDATVSPRQVSLILAYKEQKLDNKIIEQGKVYTYIEKSIAGESDVPLFLTYVDSIFAGATSDMIQLRYTWAISRDIVELKGIKDGDVICLLAGEHKVRNLTVEGLKNIVIHGCSPTSKLIISDNFTIRNCENIFIQNLDISGNIIVEEVTGFFIRKNIISQIQKQKFELINCSDIFIDSNLLLMEGEGILCRNSNNFKIQENIFKTNISQLDENIPYSYIGVESTKDIAITGNSIKTLGTENITDKSFVAGIKLDGGAGLISIVGNHVETANGSSLKIRTVGPVRVHGNSFSLTSSILGMSRNIDVASTDEKVIFTDNFCESNIRGVVIIPTTRFPRIWDQNKKLPVPYMWNVYNFEGFFYDIRDNLGIERLKMLQTNLSATQRTIDKNNLIYTSMAQPKTLKVATELNLEGDNAGLTAKGLEQAAPGKAFDKGQYYIMGWQGENYVALNGRVDKLAKLILEQGSASSDKKTLTVGETWDVGGGWTLSANSIDAKATPRQVWLTLSKDGVKKDDKVINQGNIYTYVEKSLAGETDVPVFVTYVDSVFAGATSDMVQLRYTWLISESVTQIKSGDTYGVFKLDNIDPFSKSLMLKNTDSSVSLSTDSIVDLMGNLKFKVADRADTLRFVPVVLHIQPGKYEIRGTVWNEIQIPENETQVPKSVGGTGKTAEWNVYNFAGFFYDLDTDFGEEKLNILQTDLSATQRTIDKNNLIYTAMAQPKTLKVATALNLVGNNEGLTAKGLEQAAPGKAFDKGQYYILGWQGENYVALNGRVDKLAKLILEQGTAASEKKSLTVGETWDVGGGWTLTANSIDAKATPRQVWLTLSKDGVKKDDKVLTVNSIYTFTEKSLAGETGVPVFVTYVDSVFAGATSDMVQLRYTWLISESITQLGSGNTYGVFKLVTINTVDKSLVFKNTDSSVSLPMDSIVDLMGNLKFKVADRKDVLRFYPMIEYETLIAINSIGASIDIVNPNTVNKIAKGIITRPSASVPSASIITGLTRALVTDTTQNIYLLNILCKDAIFSNNQCTLMLPSNTTIAPEIVVAHVRLFSDINSVLASVMGNRCFENITDNNIFSILASKTSILLGNITTNKIDPEPTLEKLNLQG
jgi:S-layer protein (TIGR01567 family)